MPLGTFKGEQKARGGARGDEKSSALRCRNYKSGLKNISEAYSLTIHEQSTRGH
jgi:hypothetical protein